MSKVLIVSKTRMATGICVGGINEQNGELIRLHNERGGVLSADAPYEIGDRWNLSVKRAWNVREAPHLEDKQTEPLDNERIENIGVRGIVDYVKSHDLGDRYFEGPLNGTFDGCLQSRIYITKDKVPSYSTQFWVADSDLYHVVSFEKDYYSYRGTKIKYVGMLPPIKRIPAGTIIRLSLANWWDGKGSWPEKRCYLQVSGWYLP